MQRQIEAVIFDMDGVLIDSEPFWRAAEKEVLARVGIHPTDQDLAQTMGVRIGEVVDRWYEREPWQGPTRHQVAQEIVEEVAEKLASEGRLEEGASEAIDYIHRLDLHLALASSSPKRLIEAVLSLGDLRERFEVVLSAEEEERGKPDPGIYLSAARALGIPPERCLAIEDSISGVRAAKGASMVCVAVPDPLVPEEAFAEADLILHSIAEFDDRIWGATGTEPISRVGQRDP